MTSQESNEPVYITNPQTKRKILKGGAVYKKLVAQGIISEEEIKEVKEEIKDDRDILSSASSSPKTKSIDSDSEEEEEEEVKEEILVPNGIENSEVEEEEEDASDTDVSNTPDDFFFNDDYTTYKYSLGPNAEKELTSIYCTKTVSQLKHLVEVLTDIIVAKSI